MAGLYIHVPFCPQVCSYCDFTVLKAPERLMWDWLRLIQLEMKKRPWAKENAFDTLYIGGGTPSLLPSALFTQLIESIQEHYSFIPHSEWSIECNPENINEEKIVFYKELGFNRFSLGVQNFDDVFLQKLGRSHSSQIVHNALNAFAQKNCNFSIDLMFSLPGQDIFNFLEQLKIALSYQPKHISFYGLTIEENTLFAQLEKKGKLADSISDYAEFYHEGVKFLAEHGFERYELSNFAQNGFKSKHNSAYWNHSPYLGLGMGAHSLIGKTRSWAPKHFKAWKASLESTDTIVEWESEELDELTLWNEKLWLGLRQAEGIPKSLILQAPHAKECLEILDEYLQKKWLILENQHFKVQNDGWVFLDDIASDLFIPIISLEKEL